ncbi:transient receptor potential cation channel subfamily A member 1 [Hydra vulgaris]|uniref:Transient receptor potential cation channel subfamily A member 1 n=1 Tax=Hydra vulgaris TaxID=6087 RepID=A0ABM4BD93_HYDVU
MKSSRVSPIFSVTLNQLNQPTQVDCKKDHKYQSGNENIIYENEVANFNSLQKYFSLKHTQPPIPLISVAFNEPCKKNLDKGIIPDINDETLIKFFSDHNKKDKDHKILVDHQYLNELLLSNININNTDRYGQSVMHEVARAWDTEVAQLLLKHGAAINQPDILGRTPLHVACSVNYSEMVYFLIKNGADIDSKTHGDEQKPIHFAAKNDAVDSLNVLLNFGAKIEDRDYKQRTALQLAAELDRSFAAKYLIENGADASVKDSSNMAAMVLLIKKMPNNALLALDQFHSIDRKSRTEHFNLNCLTLPINETSCFAKSPLEITVEMKQYEILLHPAMNELIKVKWAKFGKFSALKSIASNFALVILWTILMCTMPHKKSSMYTGKREYWGPIVELIAVNTLGINIVLEVKDFYKSLTRFKKYKKWRQKEIRKDLKYCHKKWPEERTYLKQEIRELKNSKLSYMKDYWNIFDWVTYFLMAFSISLHLIEMARQNKYSLTTKKYSASALMVCMWLRLLKFARPFKLLGVFVVMLGYIVNDALTILYLAMHIFIPYTALFYINFGMYNITDYSVGRLQLFYNIFQMALMGSYSYDEIANQDTVLAEILTATFIFFAVVIILNILIAMMSNTFQRVYDNAKANALMLRAAFIINEEINMSRSQLIQHYEWINAKCSPQTVYYNESKVYSRENKLFSQENDFIKTTNEINKKIDKMINTIEKLQFQIKNSMLESQSYVKPEAVETQLKSLKLINNKTDNEFQI